VRKKGDSPRHVRKRACAWVGEGRGTDGSLTKEKKEVARLYDPGEKTEAAVLGQEEKGGKATGGPAGRKR